MLDYIAKTYTTPFSVNRKIYPAGTYSFETDKFASTLLHADGLLPMLITDWNKGKSFEKGEVDILC